MKTLKFSRWLQRLHHLRLLQFARAAQQTSLGLVWQTITMSLRLILTTMVVMKQLQQVVWVRQQALEALQQLAPTIGEFALIGRATPTLVLNQSRLQLYLSIPTQ